MNNRDWEQLGNDILKTVQEAIESCNYDKLNQTVGDAVNQVVDGVARNVKNIANNANQKNTAYKAKKSFNEGGYDYQKKSYQYEEYPQNYYSQKKNQPPIKLVTKSPSRMPGVLLAIFGFTTSIFSILGGFGILVLSLLSGQLGMSFLSFLMLDLTFMIVFALIGIKGADMVNTVERFKRYVKQIGNAEFCKIEDLEYKVKKSHKFVTKDLQKMIKKGWFTQGHLDKQKTCLIVTNSMYEQYLQLEQRKEEQRKIQESQEAYRKGLSPEMQTVMAQGNEYIDKICKCNDRILGEEISAKISRIEMLVGRILDRVGESPESIQDIRKLMEYYLPTTVKLLEAYAEMDEQPVGGENIQNAKKEIEATLDTLNVAFEKLLDSLFQEKAWDVSSDISVLNAMLAQEGLKEDGLKKKG